MERERIEQLARGYLVYTQWFLVVGRAEFELRQQHPLDAVAPGVVAAGPEEPVAREAECVISEGGPGAWPLLQEIVRQAPDDEHLLGYIGAGPFETWATEARIEAVFEELAALLRDDPRWQVVTRASWNVPPALEALLQPV